MFPNYEMYNEVAHLQCSEVPNDFFSFARISKDPKPPKNLSSLSLFHRFFYSSSPFSTDSFLLALPQFYAPWILLKY
jgi:hypothetical protein